MRNRDLYYMGIAQSVATASKDPSRQVGAIIVKDDIIVSTGFNGLPRRFSKDENPEYWESPKKYDYVVHAEMNCIINAGRTNGNTVGSTLYSTFYPCHRCAVSIINAGIVRVVSPLLSQAGDASWLKSIEITNELFADCGIKVYFINP